MRRDLKHATWALGALTLLALSGCIVRDAAPATAALGDSQRAAPAAVSTPAPATPAPATAAAPPAGTSPASDPPEPPLPKIALKPIPTLSLVGAYLTIEGTDVVQTLSNERTLFRAVFRVLAAGRPAQGAPAGRCVVELDEHTPTPSAITVLMAAALGGFPSVEIHGLGAPFSLELARGTPSDEKPEWLLLSVRPDHALLRWFKPDSSGQVTSVKQKEARLELTPAHLPARLTQLLHQDWVSAPCDDLTLAASADVSLRDALSAIRAIVNQRPCKRATWVRLHNAPALESDADEVPSARTAISGRLPPEVIQRIVRRNFGVFRGCYERGLARDPNLKGGVTTRFVIDRFGDVSEAVASVVTLPDAEVAQCVVNGFKTLKFPQPEAGIVTVVYPIMLSPS